MTKEEQWVLEEKYEGNVNASGFETDRARLAAGEPVAYVIGWQPFLGLKIYLDSHPLIPPYSAKAPQRTRPLIPRPETEWWVERLLEEVSSSLEGGSAGRRPEAQQISSKKLCVSREGAADFRCLDLCTGSGAIGCAMLAALPTALVYFGEIDPAHEETIKKNIEKACGERGMVYHTPLERSHIGIGDLFAPFPTGMRFDIIACNPPYIPTGRALHASVAEHEPALALRSGADGLDLIRRIAAELPSRLNPGGEAWIECDSAHAEAARALFERAGLAAEIRTDQYERPRLLVVSWP